MAISASDVKKLREMTGAGMMDCKKALTETDGDFDAAIDFLRKKGLASAEKKAGRIAAEGVVSTYISADDKTATIIEVNSETDFVAKNEVFTSYVDALAKQINENDYADVAALNAAQSAIEPSETVEAHHKAMIAKIGENLTIRRFAKLTGDVVVSYIHMGGKIGVLVNADCDQPNDNIKEALKNIAMQIAAMNPSYVKREEISADKLAKERDIIVDSSLADPASLPKPILNAVIAEAIEKNAWTDADKATYEEQKNNKFLFNFLSDEAVQALRDIAATHKAEYLENKIFAGLVEGRFSKHLKEICLVDQTYVKAEDKENVKQYVEKVAKDNGVKFELKSFIRFETGEGLEKKNEDFAAEVAKQMQ
ncbi:MAG: elongation factor Ts [Eubacterium sp.]|nr:elongation factor Ts [Eubacterium sp.]HBE10104.1 elongation factor Ts [Lachnospiraceae bacterium]